MFYIFIVLILMIHVIDIDVITLKSHAWKGIKLLRATTGAAIENSRSLFRMRRMYVASISLRYHVE